MEESSIIPDDAPKIESFHRRITPFDNRNTTIEKQTIREQIAKLRCANHSFTKGRFDVHTISPYKTVKYGKIGAPPASCQGLSIMPFHNETQQLIVETDRMDDDFDTAVFINGKTINRYFCYSATASTLDPHYKVHYNETDVNANIYSPEECNLEAPDHYLQTRNVLHSIYTGYFPQINCMEWKFCCSLLNCSKEQYETLKTTTWVEPEYDDTRVGQVYDVVSEHLSFTGYVEKSREIMEWMEKNMIHMTFADLLQFPGGFQCIIDQATELYAETDEVSIADYAHEILKELERLAENDLSLDTDDDKKFFVAVINIVAAVVEPDQRIVFDNMIVHFTQEIPLETLIENNRSFSLQVVYQFKEIDLCAGRYNQRIISLVNMYQKT
jgi:hypothetical protein